MRTRRALPLALALLLLLGCFGCARRDDAPETVTPDDDRPSVTASDGRFTLNYSAAASMNPYTTDNVLNQTVGQLVYETLTEVDDAFAAQPKLFTAWTTEDGRSWTFTVDTTRVFHDGHVLTAQDAAYSILTARDSALYGARLAAVESAEAQDDGTVAVTLSKANTQLPVLLNVPVIENNALSSTYPSGTGPYRFDDGYASLSVFADHPDAASMPVDTICLKEFSTMEDIITAFDNGELDLVCSDPTGDLDLGLGGVSESRQYSTTNLQYIGFNTNSAFFREAAYRAALACAIDRAYAVTMLGDAGVPSPLPVHPVSAFYDERLAGTMEYDPEKAADALTACKVADYDGDGKREYLYSETEPRDIDLTFLVCSDSTQKTAAANKIAEDLRGLGLTVTVRAASWEVYGALLKEGKFDLYYGEVRLPTADRRFSGGAAHGGRGDELRRRHKRRLRRDDRRLSRCAGERAKRRVRGDAAMRGGQCADPARLL